MKENRKEPDMITGLKIAHLMALPLEQALWWFIENESADDPNRNQIFFALRARYRREVQS